MAARSAPQFSNRPLRVLLTSFSTFLLGTRDSECPFVVVGSGGAMGELPPQVVTHTHTRVLSVSMKTMESC